MIGNVPTTKRGPSHLVMFWKPRQAFINAWDEKTKKQNHLLLDCNWSSDINHWKDDSKCDTRCKSNATQGFSSRPPDYETRRNISVAFVYVSLCWKNPQINFNAVTTDIKSAVSPNSAIGWYLFLHFHSSFFFLQNDSWQLEWPSIPRNPFNRSRFSCSVLLVWKSIYRWVEYGNQLLQWPIFIVSLDKSYYCQMGLLMLWSQPIA